MLEFGDRQPRPFARPRLLAVRTLLALALGLLPQLAAADGTSGGTSTARIYARGEFPAQVPMFETFWNPFGRVGAYLPGGSVVTATHPFFQALGTNGRSCATCHQPPSGMSISLRNVHARFNLTGGKDPLFAPIDGANCPNAVQAGKPRVGRSVILNRAAIRMPIPWPPRNPDGTAKPVEFDLAITPDQDPTGCNTDPVYGLASGYVSVFRRPPSVAQINFKTQRPSGTGPILAGSLMWDGRETSLEQQAINATRGHAQALKDPTAAQIRQIVAFQAGIFSAQHRDRLAGGLLRGGASGGPVALSRQVPAPAVAEPFTLYRNWAASSEARASIARGENLFNNHIFFVSAVDGFSDRPDVLTDEATCASCHGVSGSGSDSRANGQMNLGISGTGNLFGGRPASLDLPRFTLTCRADVQPGSAGFGPIVTNDPGLALITGKCADIGKFTVPHLRALAAREPYFHGGSSESLEDVVLFYDKRFEMGLGSEDIADLVNFMAAL